jgi:hypothetical protein
MGSEALYKREMQDIADQECLRILLEFCGVKVNIAATAARPGSEDRTTLIQGDYEQLLKLLRLANAARIAQPALERYEQELRARGEHGDADGIGFALDELRKGRS